MTKTDFFDTDILVYAVSGDAAKADRAEQLIASGGIISVQVLNEFASVATRRLHRPVALVRDILVRFRSLCTVVPLDVATNEDGLDLAERHRLPIYDSMIVAAALRAGCTVLYSEDFADGQVIAGLSIRNPFAAHT
ncbi:MAG: PIN domain-containing protein [Xanthobacteraceae bacterium]